MRSSASSVNLVDHQAGEMPARAELVALAHDLRYARTRHLSIEIAEQVQHTIVRIEQMLASPDADVAKADALIAEGRALLDECAAVLKSRASKD